MFDDRESAAMVQEIRHDGDALSAAHRLHHQLADSLSALSSTIETLADINYAPGARDKESIESAATSMELVELIGAIAGKVAEMQGIHGLNFQVMGHDGEVTEATNSQNANFHGGSAR